MKGYIKIEAQPVPEDMRDLPGRHAAACSVEIDLRECSTADKLTVAQALLRSLEFDVEDLAKLVALFLDPGGRFADHREIVMPLIRRDAE